MKYNKLEIFQPIVLGFSIKIVSILLLTIYPEIFKIAQNIKNKMYEITQVRRISVITRQVYVLNDRHNQFVKD